jgi:peptidoglycan/xylan/chitin deacetylase (PgdA/CDA1 family)
MEVTLTFDNGPDLEETPKVLAILRRHGIKATFFIQCNKLTSPPMRAMAERTRDEGHWIGNHTLNHLAPLGMTDDPLAPAREIGEAQALLGDLVHPRRFFRPNGKGRTGPHLLSQAAVDFLAAGQYSCILWSVMPRDGTDPPGWPGRAMTGVRRQAQSTVVVHDRVNGGMPYLEPFIRQVLEEGGSFRQEFSPDVVVMEAGRPLVPLETISNSDPLAATLPANYSV